MNVLDRTFFIVLSCIVLFVSIPVIFFLFLFIKVIFAMLGSF